MVKMPISEKVLVEFNFEILWCSVGDDLSNLDSQVGWSDTDRCSG